MNTNDPNRGRSRARGHAGAIGTALAVAASFVTALVATTAVPAAATTPPVVTTGTHVSCAITSAGAASCWGQNGYGQLGDGSTTDSHVAVQVTGLPLATAIDAGDDHVCAIDSTKAPWCWGHNLAGALGTGTNTDSSVPVMVAGSLQATQIGAGNQFSCALLVGGTVDCWGRGTEGQLGNGTDNNSKKPKPVTGLQGIRQIAVGGFHACALLTDGGVVKCWGANTFGALGNGTTTSSNVPVLATGLTNVQAITAGGFHTCPPHTSLGLVGAMARLLSQLIGLVVEMHGLLPLILHALNISLHYVQLDVDSVFEIKIKTKIAGRQLLFRNMRAANFPNRKTIEDSLDRFEQRLAFSINITGR